MEVDPVNQLITSWVKTTRHMQIICKAHVQLRVQRSHSTKSKPPLTSIKVLPKSARALYVELYVGFAYDLHMSCNVQCGIVYWLSPPN